MSRALQRSISPAAGALSVTPNDITTFSPSRGLYVGVSGDVSVTMADDVTITLVGLASGVVHPLSIKRVRATGTTATDIIVFY